VIVIRGRLLTYGEVWFDEEPPGGSSVDLLLYRQRPTPVDGGSSEPFLSLANDLTVDAQSLITSFGSNNRYKINRANSKDALEFDHLPDTRAVLDEFIAFFDDFARQKRIQVAYRRGLDAACGAGRLTLSAARHNGERIVWHAHIVGRSAAVLLHSASHFRGKDSGERALVGRANRWLHWRDMLAFKGMGLTTYDWGGLFADETVPEQATINSFKREFGGRLHSTYNCMVGRTMKGRAYLAGHGVVSRLSSWRGGSNRI